MSAEAEPDTSATETYGDVVNELSRLVRRKAGNFVLKCLLTRAANIVASSHQNDFSVHRTQTLRNTTTIAIRMNTTDVVIIANLTPSTGGVIASPS